MIKKTRVMLFMAIHKPRFGNVLINWIEDELKALFLPNIELSVTAATSLCQSYNLPASWYQISIENKRLGYKMNEGLKYAMKMKHWDYMLLMGDDDLIDRRGIKLIKASILEGIDWGGFTNLIMVDSGIGELKEVSTAAVFGAGMIIKRKFLENTFDKLGFIWEPSISGGLDDSFRKNVRAGNRAMKEPIRFQGLSIIDIKGSDNINPYGRFKGGKVSETYSIIDLDTRRVLLRACKNR